MKLSTLPALLALLALVVLHGCEWGSSPGGGGTEGEGLSGIVVDPAGRGVANARVFVFPDPGSSLAKGANRSAVLEAVLDSARTDAQGMYRFDSLPAGEYALLARIIRHDSTLTALVRDIAHEGGKRRLGEVQLKAAGTLALTVLSEEGQPVSGARCTVAELSGLGGLGGLEDAGDFEATSGASGKCAIADLPEGTFRVSVEHPDRKPTLSAPVRVRSGRTVNGGIVELEAVADTSLPQEIQILVDADTYVNRSSDGQGAHVNNNFGAASGFLVGVYDLNTIPTGLLHFTLPANVPAARIVQATLRIHAGGWTIKNVRPDSVTVFAHAVLRAWKEGSGVGTPNSASVDGVTARERFWGSQDGVEDWSVTSIGFNDLDVSASPVAAAARATRQLGAWEFDLTMLARNWAGAPAQNFGVLLRVAVPTSNALVQDYPDFYSRESAVADSLKPRLILTIAP